MHNPEQAMGFLMYILAEYRKSCLFGIQARNLWASAMDHWTSDVGFQAIRYPRKYKVEKKEQRTCNFFPQHFFCSLSKVRFFSLFPLLLIILKVSWFALCAHWLTTSTTRVHIWNCSFYNHLTNYTRIHDHDSSTFKYMISIYF